MHDTSLAIHKLLYPSLFATPEYENMYNTHEKRMKREGKKASDRVKVHQFVRQDMISSYHLVHGRMRVKYNG